MKRIQKYDQDKIKNNKRNLKTIIGIVIGIIIGISTTVGAATVFNSKDITYSSSATSKTNVKDSLDELYSKASQVGQCPEGQLCRDAIIKNVQLGDYISMTPTLTSYTIPTSVTGYTSSQTINLSELNLWRVIRKNEDGTVDVVSEYVSSTKVYFRGEAGYINAVGGLNTIASKYTNAKYVQSTRHMGYSNQIEKCVDFNSHSNCPDDTGYKTDLNLVISAIGTDLGRTATVDGVDYWLASRYNDRNDQGINTVSSHGFDEDYWEGLIESHSRDLEGKKAIRPILTLKSDVQIKSGDGKSASTAYQLN